MKETKVYIDELPESCDECKYYTQFTDGMGCIVAQELRPMDECGNYMQASCPLRSIKDHDQELVKEVCEKIREHLSEQKKSLKDTFSPYSNGKAFIISAVEDNLNKIEKEFEDGE